MWVHVARRSLLAFCIYSFHALHTSDASARPCMVPLLQPEPYIFNFWASIGVVLSSLPLFVVYPMVSFS